jgi:hypothetical protein
MDIANYEELNPGAVGQVKEVFNKEVTQPKELLTR